MEIRVCVCRLVEIRVCVCVNRPWGVPHDSPKVAIFTQGACLQFATFWRPPNSTDFTWKNAFSRLTGVI